MKATSFDHLSQELWSLIFCHVPHVSRLQCLCVSQKWYRFLKELEDELKEATPGSPQLLFLEKKEDEEDGDGEIRLQWSALDPVSHKTTRMKLSWPPGWDPAVHGCIQGGGRSGLVALWDCKASQYWVGSPVHDKWEKVPGLNAFQDLPFHRRGFHFIPEGRKHKAYFDLDPAVPCFKPVEKPGEDKRFWEGGEPSGFYHIVQFQLIETHDRRPVHDRNFGNWVIQVYSSRSRSWKFMGEPEPACRSLIHSSVSGASVYFLAAVEPTNWAGGKLSDWYGEGNLCCPLSVWVYRLDTGVLSQLFEWSNLNDEIVEMYWRSMQLRVTKGGDVSVISVGHPFMEDPDECSLYKLVDVHDENCWDVEKEIELDKLLDGDTGFDELIDSDSQDWGFNIIAFNPGEGYLDDLYGIAHEERETMYTKKEYLDSAAEEVSGFTTVVYFSKQERLWKCWELLCPLYKDGVLPVVPFLPCCDLPCCT